MSKLIDCNDRTMKASEAHGTQGANQAPHVVMESESKRTESESPESESKQMSKTKATKANKNKCADAYYSRNTTYDALIFCGPALLAFFSETDVVRPYFGFFTRLITMHLVFLFQYRMLDRHNYNNKPPHAELISDRRNYLASPMLTMYVMVAIQIFIPGFFDNRANDPANGMFWASAWNVLVAQTLISEPLYYFVHKWLHVPWVFRWMHGFHHTFVNAASPALGQIQHETEHVIYIAVFAPATFVPYFATGYSHWSMQFLWFVIFDAVNAWGHMNFRVRHPIFTHKWSPLRYLFYTPEGHRGHHVYFTANYSLFMPIWDHLLGTHKEYRFPDHKGPNALHLPEDQLDFTFIAHPLPSWPCMPEFSPYYIYDNIRLNFLPLELEMLITHIFVKGSKFFCDSVEGVKMYTHYRYLIDGKQIGRVVPILKSPLDYMRPGNYQAINDEIVSVIRAQNRRFGTRVFGLGNLNKMRQLNEGGKEIVARIESDLELKDRNIKIWTGDTLTSASVYQQIIDIPDLKKFFWIGANGKIGKAVCTLLSQTHPDVTIMIYSSFKMMSSLPNVVYTHHLSDMLKFQVVFIGKQLSPKTYHNVLGGASEIRTRLLLDYTVPFTPIVFPNISHCCIGVLDVTDEKFLRGHYDAQTATGQYKLHPCHGGCIINAAEHRDNHEVGEIDPSQLLPTWKKALKYGFRNQPLPAHALKNLAEKAQREEKVNVGRFKAQLRERSQKTLRGRAEFPDRDEFVTSESERGDGDITSESKSERPSSELIDVDLSEFSETPGR